jgi:uncharacterized protein
VHTVSSSRIQVVDLLRLLALAGVVVVNCASFKYAWTSPVAGIVEPAGSVAAALAHGLIVALFQNKAYPLLAFLVGYGVALQLRQPTAHNRQRRTRVAYWLIVLGLLHGLLLYFGDILLAYGIMSLILIRLVRARLRTLWRICRWLAAYMVVITLLASTLPLDIPTPLLANAATWLEALHINASTYGFALMGLPFDLLPLVTLFGLLGLIAARLRWLEHAHHWQPTWQRIARVALPWGLGLNIANGLACAVLGYHGLYYNVLQQMAPFLIGPLLSLGIVAAVALQMQHATPLLTRLAPAGRYTLSMYLGTSLVLMFSIPAAGFGLGVQLDTVRMLIASLALYALWVGIALWMAQRRIKGPVERLLH